MAILNEVVIHQKIDKLSRMYNYFDNKIAIKILSTMTLEEAEIVLSNAKVEHTILRIDDSDILRKIFSISPAFFQEVMFSNEKVQDLLITPRKSLTRKKIIESYHHKDFFFSEKEIRELELFLHTIKSSKIYEQIVESKFFQRIVVMFYEKQIKKSFFHHLNVPKLFYHIINDEEIYNTRRQRRKNIVEVFNKVSNHILLPDDYQTLISDGKSFMYAKKHSCQDEEKIFIDRRTLSILTTPMLEELLEFKNIDREYIKNYLKDGILSKIGSANDFSNIFSRLLLGNYNCFRGMEEFYFKIIVEEFDHNEKLKENFIDFIYHILCQNQTLDLYNQGIAKDVLCNKMKNEMIQKEHYQKLFFLPSEMKTIFYLKFGELAERMDYLNGISAKQLMYLNVKHIHQILKKLNMENEDELSNLYALAIKLYMVFGLEKTIKILDGDYGILNRYFFDNVSKLDVSNVPLVKEGKKYIPKILNGFVNFMFANQEENHFKNMLLDSSNLLNRNWSYVYNHYDSIKERCHGIITLKKINVILKELSPAKDIPDVAPNNYKLQENYILDDVCLGNKTGSSNLEVYKMVLDIYEKMKHRIESSIPYVKGKAVNGYSYEMMRLNDPIAFTLGYKANSCIRVNDIAHDHLLHATLCRNGRILLILDKNQQLAAFVPLKRNGEVLIANSIECLHKLKNDNAISAFVAAVNDIVKTSIENEQDAIKLVCIGQGAYAKPKGIPFPNHIPTPTIWEKDDPIYSHTDQYHKNLEIIYQDSSIDLTMLKYGNPECSYMDPRMQIEFCDFKNASDVMVERALKVINAIRYENANSKELENFKLCRRQPIDKCVYNEDWYIITTYDGKIYGDFLKFNPQTEIEYKMAFSKFVDINYSDNKEKCGKEKTKHLSLKIFE